MLRPSQELLNRIKEMEKELLESYKTKARIEIQIGYQERSIKQIRQKYKK